VSYIEAKQRVVSDLLYVAEKRIKTYTATWVVYTLFDLILTEFLPGPLGLSVVLKSERRMNVLLEAKVKF
jgi:hypothetical protein